MYESFFHFARRPFSAVPDSECYFPTSSLEQARLTLTRCIDRSAGPGLLIAPSGLGKTLLCQVLARHFANRFAVAMLANSRLSTPRALLQAILFELGLPFRDLGEGELRLSLIDHVASTKGGVPGMLLIVDEAHLLSPRLLEEIRMITNLVRNGQLRVRVVLSGGTRLEERFASTKLESFNQRIAARCYLEPLKYDETCDYVRAHLAAAGASPHSIFTEDALTAIHRAGDGIPRLINQVADHALVLAAAGGQPIIDAAGINEAWSDLQQLPSVFGSEREAVRSEGQGACVEFGSLSDEEDGTAAAASVATAVVAARRSDPSEHLDRIERHIAEAQRDLGVVEPRRRPKAGGQFDPQASLRPEVELVFEETEDPFAESFAEEEVIQVRTAPFRHDPPLRNDSRPDDLPATATAKRVVAAERAFEPESPAGKEGLPERTLSAASEPPVVAAQERYAYPDNQGCAFEKPVAGRSSANPPDRPRLAVVADSDEDLPVDDASEAADAPLDTWSNDERVRDDVPAFPGSRPGYAEFGSPTEYGHAGLRYAQATVAMAGGPFVSEQEATAVTVIPLSLWTDAVAESPPTDDRDIIVVDDRAAAGAEAAVQPHRARRQDYRRLFAQLRQREA